jgi:hypothetical protein
MKGRPERIEGLEITRVEDGFLIYQRDRDRVHYLNHTAVLVLELCNGRNGAGEIAELVRKTYGLPRAPEREVDEVLGQLHDEGLIADGTG